MNDKPPQRSGLPVPKTTDEGIYEDDFDALDKFCDNVELDDISFDDWRKTHDNLDVNLWVKLQADMVQNDEKYTISFVRTISSACGKHKTKKRITRQVQLNSKGKKSLKLVFRHEGDQAEELKGDLIVHFTVT